MRIDQAFAKCGFEIVDVAREPDRMVIDVRISARDPKAAGRWSHLFEPVLLASESSKGMWSAEISKRFFTRNGRLRYLWRLVLSGNLAKASSVVVGAAIDSLRIGNELDEVPVVGGAARPPDPASGRYKGAYKRDDGDRASQLVASAFSVGG